MIEQKNLDTNAEPAEEKQCANCKAPLLGPHCYRCGQPEKGLIRHFSGIIGDFFDSVFDFDSRTLRTLIPLYFRPGFLSNEYFAGRRVSYVTPLRLYIFFSVIAFFAISFSTDRDDTPIVVSSTGQASTVGKTGQTSEETVLGDKANAAQKAEQAITAQEVLLKRMESNLRMLPQAQREQILTEMRADFAGNKSTSVKAKNTDEVFADVEKKDSSNQDKSSDDGPVVINFGDGENWDAQKNPINISWAPQLLNDWLNQQAAKFQTAIPKIKHNPKQYLEHVLSIAPQTLLLILPIFALLLKLVYLFKKRLYTEHLIVALHSHSFICLSILLLLGVNALYAASEGIALVHKMTGWIFLAMWLWIPLYLYLAQKRIYQQGWAMTTFKFFLVGFAYVMLISFAMTLTMLVGVVSM